VDTLFGRIATIRRGCADSHVEAGRHDRGAGTSESLLTPPESSFRSTGSGDPSGYDSAVIDGTVPSRQAGLLLGALRRAGLGEAVRARLPELADDVLADELARPSSSSAIQLWREFTLLPDDTFIDLFPAGALPLGTFGVWDYLYTAGGDLADSIRLATAHTGNLADPSVERLDLIEAGGLLRLQRANSVPGDPDVVAVIEQFAMLLYLTRSRDATGRMLTPTQVSFTQRAPRRHGNLARALGTDHIEFGAEYNSLTLRGDDGRLEIPQFRPGLGEVLGRHAEMLLTASRPVRSWQAGFRTVLRRSFDGREVSLDAVARRMRISTRTLQRRLAEHHTTWREEVEAARREVATTLLRDSPLPVAAIAARVGYSDVRTLRRAVHRWHGRSPSALRAA
jgi:AraC-like DNA-binding protein